MENTQVGPFRILKRLGTSRRQQVFHARQEAQDRDVVLKFINLPPTIEWTKALDKIERETVELRKLRHENLVRVYGVGVHEEDSKIFFATELIEGEPLSAILARRGKLAPDLVVEYGHQIAEALKYIHNREIIHSKLTPDKIIITPDHKVKISDLRLNRAKKRRWDATRKRDLEIAAYMAPEQFDEGATQKSDFYSLGVILYELLTGKLPYEPDTMGRMAKVKKEATAPSVAEEVMNCPIWLDRIVTQMVQPDPRQRPHSARAITFAFEEIKKIDATQKSAASQVAGNFNPLTAGVDKTAARRALGKKPTREKYDGTPFYQKTPFMIAALVGLLAVIVFFAIPKSHAKRLKQAESQVASLDPDDWRKAAVELNFLMESSDEAIAERATDLYFESKEKSLEMNARSGVAPGARNFYTGNIKSYIDAVQKFLGGEHAAAKFEFERLVREVDPEGDERHVYGAATKQLQQLSGILSLPANPETLMAMIEKYSDETNELKLMQGTKVLARISNQFRRNPAYEEICDAADAQLIVIQNRLDGVPEVPVDEPVE
ncbi:serine/threonine protein kinase [Mariniblastus fucicola]|uniref:serine/threonine protein kinase n=1 Tax=Mariniblastus fucicola TaxID=980251 RepID=UPI0009465484|nr:serine/threonine-protein kinase [Mariniblastus fucicola]